MYGTYHRHGIYKLSLQDVIPQEPFSTPAAPSYSAVRPFRPTSTCKPSTPALPSVSLNDLSARSTFSQNNVRVNCLMNLGGRPSLLQKSSFDFDLPNVNEDEAVVRIVTEEEKNIRVIYLPRHPGVSTLTITATRNKSQSSVAMKSLLSSLWAGNSTKCFSTLLGNNSNWNIRDEPQHRRNGMERHGRRRTALGRLLNNRLLINGNFGYQGQQHQRTVTSSATSTCSGC